MFRRNKSYSLNQRIMLFTIIPLLVILFVLFLYLNLYRISMEQMAESTFNNIVENRQQQLEKNLDEIRGIAKDIAYSSMLQQYLTEPDAGAKAQTYRHFQNYLGAVVTGTDTIISAYAGLGSHSSVHMADGYLFAFEKTKQQLGQEQTLTRNTEHFTAWERQQVLTTDRMVGMCFYIGSPIRSGRINEDQPMIGAVMYEPAKLLPPDESGQGHLAILMMDDTPLLLSGEVDGAQMERLIAAEGSTTTIDGVSYYLARSTLMQEPDMKLIYLVPYEALVRHGSFLENQTLMFIVLAALLLSVSVTLILSAIFRPIRQLCRNVDNIKAYGEQLPKIRAKELDILTDAYNAMSARVAKSIEQEKQMVDRQYQLEIQKNRMEMRAFRNQINPHFLFNTLECINSMVRYYHVEPVSKLINNLSGCFHYSLYSPMQVMLAEEINHLNNYLEIIETRFPGKYRIIYRIAPEAREVLVPSLLLQPLAENAVTHAFLKHTKKARPTIVLQAQLDAAEEFLNIDIIDNGMGMDEEKLAEVLETAHTADYVEKHISLNNVYRRLALLYGEGCMQIVSRNGYYTRISVRIPLSQPALVMMQGSRHPL